MLLIIIIYLALVIGLKLHPVWTSKFNDFTLSLCVLRVFTHSQTWYPAKRWISRRMWKETNNLKSKSSCTVYTMQVYINHIIDFCLLLGHGKC